MCSMQCLSSFNNSFLDFIHFCRFTKNSRTTVTIYIYIYIYIERERERDMTNELYSIDLKLSFWTL